MENNANQTTAHIEVRDLTMAYGSFVIQHDLSFTVKRVISSSSWVGADAARARFSGTSSV